MLFSTTDSGQTSSFVKHTSAQWKSIRVGLAKSKNHYTSFPVKKSVVSVVSCRFPNRVRRYVFTCVRWQVTLWQVTL